MCSTRVRHAKHRGRHLSPDCLIVNKKSGRHYHFKSRTITNCHIAFFLGNISIKNESLTNKSKCKKRYWTRKGHFSVEIYLFEIKKRVIKVHIILLLQILRYNITYLTQPYTETLSTRINSKRNLHFLYHKMRETAREFVREKISTNNVLILRWKISFLCYFKNWAHFEIQNSLKLLKQKAIPIKRVTIRPQTLYKTHFQWSERSLLFIDISIFWYHS